jgi:hypothetical protein
VLPIFRGHRARLAASIASSISDAHEDAAGDGKHGREREAGNSSSEDEFTNLIELMRSLAHPKSCWMTLVAELAIGASPQRSKRQVNAPDSGTFRCADYRCYLLTDDEPEASASGLSSMVSFLFVRSFVVALTAAALVR